ncbi:hypothetical protein B0H17DRAFT_1049067 [Mycena rosella]|uniref:Uncharacterized protein n=1 Tax=Mycena rosella TaxID=1033263 RepID=A0AAD7DW14_MYCRO|nr:hypothetical protein B0H17DRAFT_1049067 [Mycena rosella]
MSPSRPTSRTLSAATSSPSRPSILQRTDYSAEFLSAHMAYRTLDLVQDHLERVQGQLAAALNTSTTRSVAGKLSKGMMHRALTRGMQLPAVLGAGTVGSFVCETSSTKDAQL